MHDVSGRFHSPKNNTVHQQRVRYDFFKNEKFQSVKQLSNFEFQRLSRVSSASSSPPSDPCHSQEALRRSTNASGKTRLRDAKNNNIATKTDATEYHVEFVKEMRMMSSEKPQTSSMEQKDENEDLIDLSGVVVDLVVLDEKHRCPPAAIPPLPDEKERLRDLRLPTVAIIYDYTIQPVGMWEHKRIYLPELCESNSPFLRPIIIDGIGLVKAFLNCCPLTQFVEFPLIPAVRCLFYWISRGHHTVLVFPTNFNPIKSEDFKATRAQCYVLESLKQWGMIQVFKTRSDLNKKWFDDALEQRACLITTVMQWRMSMPNELKTGITGANKHKYERPSNMSLEPSPERLLQPFFGDDGDFVFFSSFSSSGHCVAETILDRQKIQSQAEFDAINAKQLHFADQCKKLKLLYSYLPQEKSRFRETAVMMKMLERLHPFLS